MTEILETAGPYRVRLEVDQDPQNPRKEYDNLCHVITIPGSDYIDVDDTGGPLQHGWSSIMEQFDKVEVFTRWATIFHGAVVEYHTPNEGANSIWYLTPKEIAEVPDPKEAIKAEIEEYQNWCEGEVYGYIIEKAVDWARKDGEDGEMTTWEDVESCWGFFGSKYAEESAKEAFEPYKTEAEQS